MLVRLPFEMAMSALHVRSGLGEVEPTFTQRNSEVLAVVFELQPASHIEREASESTNLLGSEDGSRIFSASRFVFNSFSNHFSLRSPCNRHVFPFSVMFENMPPSEIFFAPQQAYF